MDIEETFEINDKSNKSSKIKDVIERLEDANFNFENFEAWHTESETNSRIINAQIENKTMDYKESKNNAIDDLEKAKENGEIGKEFIPIGLFKLQRTIHHDTLGVLSWNILLAKQQKIIIKKLFVLLREAKQSMVVRDTLRETKEFIKEQNNLVKDIVNNQVTNIQEKIITVAREMNKETNLIQKENIMVLTNCIDKFSQNNSRNIDSIGEILSSASESKSIEIEGTKSISRETNQNIYGESKVKLEKNLSKPNTTSFPSIVGDTLLTEEVEVKIPKPKEESSDDSIDF